MPTEGTPEYVKALYEYASNIHKAQDLVYAIPLLERVAKLDDPFYGPFALSLLAQSYKKIGREDLEAEVFKRITALPKDHQAVLNPRWLATCYEKTGNLKMASAIFLDCLRINPNEVGLTASLAEVYVLDGKLDEAEVLGGGLIERPEVKFQIVGRMILGFALALANKYDQSAKEFVWLGQFLLSSESVPPGTWDFRDMQPLVNKLGAQTRVANELIKVLSGNSTLQEFSHAWNEMGMTTAPRSA